MNSTYIAYFGIIMNVCPELVDVLAVSAVSKLLQDHNTEMADDTKVEPNVTNNRK